MPEIIVTKGFRFRPGAGEPMRDLPPGRHELTAAEMDHWFVKGCIEEGRARLAPAKASAKQGKPSATSKGEGTLLSRMLSVFPSLSAGDLKKDGTPKAQAVADAVGESVSAAEVSAAWAEYQAQQGEA